ncbi:MAG: sulfate adenylyltransferase subunit CysN [Candidatus Nanopelagicales bacterium]
MTVDRDLVTGDIEQYLELQERKSLLRFITCGSVDDGKSTLIGRLLYESHLVFEDQLTALETDSKRFGTQGAELDLALLVDGLSAEREQGITIDVAYRFFATDVRKFIVADTPGHEQYTRNMVTGASTADVAVILIDARKGVQTQTRRHSFLVSLLGIRKVAIAINKVDLVDYSQDIVKAIESDYRSFAAEIGLTDVVAIPLSALIGENVTERSALMPWYQGPTLMDYLETVQVEGEERSGSFRMPVQWVNRPNSEFRGFSGQLGRGPAAVGAPVLILPGQSRSTIDRILGPSGDLDEALAGQPVTITLSDEVDVSRGDVICAADEPAQVADQFEAHVVWMAEEQLLPARQYLLKIGTKVVGAAVTRIKYKINVNTLEHVSAETLALNDIGLCNLALDQPVAFDPYSQNRELGGFILIDRITGNTVGAGLIRFALRRSANVHWQSLEVTKDAHAQLKGQRPCVVWFTGLSGAGKSAIGNLVEKRLHALGRHTVLLDGDNVRHGLNRDLGFTAADRVENVRRVGEVAHLMVDAGLIVLVTFISPFREERAMAREMVEPGEFCEVFVDTPLAVAEARDVKGLYAKARRGELRNFTGIDSPYERPEAPEVTIDTTEIDPEAASELIVDRLREMGALDPA